MNALELCEGSITRVRHTKERIEKTILDFFIVCDQILPLVSNMKIDCEGEITLTQFNGKVVRSDHRMLKLDVDLVFHKEKNHERNELFNVRNEKCQQLFSEFTSKGDMFSRCFSSDNVDVNTQFKRWQRRFNKAIHACFHKTRITQNEKKTLSHMDVLMEKRKTILKKKTLTAYDEEQIENIECEITDEIATKEFKKLEKLTGELDKETNTNIWKELRKAFPPKTNPIPTGIKNTKNKVITHP